MKQIISFLLFLPLFAAAQQTDKFTIEAKLPDLPDSVEVVLSHASSSTPILKTFSKNKEFILKGDLPFAGPGRIVLSGKGISLDIDLYVVKGKTTITGSAKNKKTWKYAGSPEHKAFGDFLKVFVPSFESLNTVNAQVMKVFEMEKRNALIAEFNAIKARMANQIDSFVAKNDEYTVSAFLVHTTKDLYMNEEPLRVAGWLDKLTAEASVSIYKNAVQREVDNALVGSVGSMAMDFTQADTSGVPVKLSSFRGKYVLLDFWASWCGPCRMENPNVVEAFNKFKSKNFTVLGVSLDRPGNKDAWVQAIKDDNLTWTHVSDLQFWQNQVAQMYKVGSIPQNFLVDPSGKIIAKNLRGAALEEKLCEVLGCK